MKCKRLLAGLLSAAMIAAGTQLPVGVFAAPFEGMESDTQLSLSLKAISPMPLKTGSPFPPTKR